VHQQLWGYKVEDKLYVGVREQKRLNTADLDQCIQFIVPTNKVHLVGTIN
jgi:hypothetical protein